MFGPMHYSDHRLDLGFWQRDRVPIASTAAPKRARLKWYSSDSEERYRQCGNTAYGPDAIDYDFNSHGFRSMEIDISSTKPKIMFVGCSFTQGIGLPYNELWTTIVCKRLGDKLGVEFEQHNFGMAGHGNDVMASNVSQIVPVLRPNLVIVLFTDTIRRTHYTDFNSRTPFTSIPTRALGDAYRPLMTLQNDAMDFYGFCRDFALIDATCSVAGVPWAWQAVSDHFLPRLPEIYDLDPDVLNDYVRVDNMLPIRFPDFVLTNDYARDNMHGGAKTNAEFAQCIVDEIVRRKVVRL